MRQKNNETAFNLKTAVHGLQRGWILPVRSADDAQLGSGEKKEMNKP
jgi:hypothetical protein